MVGIARRDDVFTLWSTGQPLPAGGFHTATTFPTINLPLPHNLLFNRIYIHSVPSYPSILPSTSQEGGICFEMDLQVAYGFYLTVAASLAFYLSGVAGSPTHKYIHRMLYPHDEPPPYGWSQGAACRCRL